MHSVDSLIVGAGIFGLCTAISLREKGLSVTVLEAGQIPNPLAASTDISKIIRMEYGSDEEYMDMAAHAMLTWKEWNNRLNETIFHKTGFLLLTSKPLGHPSQSFEQGSYNNLLKRGFDPERLNAESIQERFPAFRPGHFIDGFFHKNAGYAMSGRSLELLADLARSMGVSIIENQPVSRILIEKSKAIGVKTTSGETHKAGKTIICAGNFTPYLLPELMPFIKVTGHPVFHLKPSDPNLYKPEKFPVFAADISNTGWYGFPLHPKEAVVKVALHSEGTLLHPGKDERTVSTEDHNQLRQFLQKTIPPLANAPVVYTRKCCYTDTLDGHFWIDHHPEIESLIVGSGGSGHGFKMGPVVAEMITALALGHKHDWSDRYGWRSLDTSTPQQEEARFISNRTKH